MTAKKRERLKVEPGGKACRAMQQRKEIPQMSETLTMVRIPYQEYAALYSPMEGLARGTLFQALDKPLDAVGGAPRKPKGKKPWLDYLALGFALDDLRLFLDVNPENREALAEYNELLRKRKELRTRLEEQEGMTDVFSESDAWSWAVAPFPWM